VQNELSYDTSERTDNVYRLSASIPKDNWFWETTPLLLAPAVQKRVPGIEMVSRICPDQQPVIEVNNKLTYEKKAAYVDASWFQIIPQNFVEGNFTSFTKSPYQVILTESAAKKYFGNKNAIGASLRIDQINYLVNGIVKDAPANSSFKYDVLLPIEALLTNKRRKENDENWSNFNYLTFVKLEPGSNIRMISRKITQLLPDNKAEETKISLIALKDIHFETGLQLSFVNHGNRSTVYIFMLLAFLLLLTACINYVNLTTAKASLRAKEVSIRKIAGAKRLQLFNQFIVEAILISVFSLIAILILLRLGLPWFNQFTGNNFVLQMASWNVWAVIGATLLAALVLNSIYPAVLLSSFKPMSVFRGVSALNVSDNYLRKSLVVVQFTISTVLIICTLVIYRQMSFIQQADAGYSRSQVVSFALPFSIDQEKREPLLKNLKHSLLKNSSVLNVTASNQLIVNIGSWSSGSADWDGRDTAFNPRVAQLSADADYKNTMQLKMESGRWFEEGNKADERNVVLNQTAVKQFNISEPVVGKRFAFHQKTGVIIGVINDFTFESAHKSTAPLVAFNDPKWNNYLMVRIAPGKTQQAINDLQNSWSALVPGHPLEYSFLDDSFNDMYIEDQRASSLLFIFSVIAILIASLGLLALASFSAEKRRKEIGIRKVLGASVSAIAMLLSKDFVKLVLISILIASPLAYWAMNKWIQNFAHRIELSWWMFAAAGMFAVFTAVITTSFQAVKAAVVNPVKSLRTE
jgi:ABC-type antimicrobial peptide transport system permease subunit